jgi:hypothetical protein
MKYKLTEEVVKEAAQFMAKAVRLTLEAKHTRTAIRATWKKTGGGWQPVNVVKQKVRANFIASGTLVKSIEPFSQGLEFGVEYAQTGEFLRQGRQPFGKNKGGKGIPISNMREWSKMRNIRPRDLSNNQFIKNTESNRKAMNFMMNRKIKHFGIEPFDFLKMPRVYTLDKYRSKIIESVKKDIQNGI